MAITMDDLDNWFSYHPPKDDYQIAAYEDLRAAGKVLAATILGTSPRGAEQSAAFRKGREAVMVANSAIACASPVGDDQTPG